MIPSAWASLVLALAAFRLTRLAGWDDLPPIVRARAWLVGEKAVTTGSSNARMGLSGDPVETTYRYRWPTLAYALHCAFCSGAWWSLAVYVAWRLEPSWTLTAMFPLAVSAFVGTWAKVLDP